MLHSHVKDPSELVHEAFAWQGDSATHSSISTCEKEQLTQEDELVSHEAVKVLQTASRNSLQLCRMAVHGI